MSQESDDDSDSVNSQHEDGYKEYYPRRSEEKPRVDEHSYKRYWNKYYKKIQNQRRKNQKKTRKAMKLDIDENEESYLFRLSRSKKIQKQNDKAQRRLKKLDYLYDIKDSLHDHSIRSMDENRTIYENIDRRRAIVEKNRRDGQRYKNEELINYFRYPSMKSL